MITLFKDRVVERPNTYTRLDNADGTITLIPVTGAVSEAGTPLNAATMNGIIQAIQSLDLEKQDASDPALNTTVKTITGAINQLYDAVNAIGAYYGTDVVNAKSINTNAPFSGTIKYSKAFNVVTVTLNATSNNVGNNVLLGNLSAGYRPPIEVFVPIFVITGSNTWGYNKTGLKIGTNGDITFVTETGESTKAIYCSFSFHI